MDTTWTISLSLKRRRGFFQEMLKAHRNFEKILRNHTTGLIFHVILTIINTVPLSRLSEDIKAFLQTAPWYHSAGSCRLHRPSAVKKPMHKDYSKLSRVVTRSQALASTSSGTMSWKFCFRISSRRNKLIQPFSSCSIRFNWTFILANINFLHKSGKRPSLHSNSANIRSVNLASSQEFLTGMQLLFVKREKVTGTPRNI